MPMRTDEKHTKNGPDAQPKGTLRGIEESIETIRANLDLIAKAQEDTLRYLKEIYDFLCPPEPSIPVSHGDNEA